MKDKIKPLTLNEMLSLAATIRMWTPADMLHSIGDKKIEFEAEIGELEISLGERAGEKIIEVCPKYSFNWDVPFKWSLGEYCGNDTRLVEQYGRAVKSVKDAAEGEFPKIIKRFREIMNLPQAELPLSSEETKRVANSIGIKNWTCEESYNGLRRGGFYEIIEDPLSESFSDPSYHIELKLAEDNKSVSVKIDFPDSKLKQYYPHEYLGCYSGDDRKLNNLFFRLYKIKEAKEKKGKENLYKEFNKAMKLARRLSRAK